jgi:hypothetical protein
LVVDEPLETVDYPVVKAVDELVLVDELTFPEEPVEYDAGEPVVVPEEEAVGWQVDVAQADADEQQPEPQENRIATPPRRRGVVDFKHAEASVHVVELHDEPEVLVRHIST